MLGRGSKGKHCIRFKRTAAGKRCAKFGGRKRKGKGKKGGMRGALGRGAHCIRFKKTSGGKRCAKFA